MKRLGRSLTLGILFALLTIGIVATPELKAEQTDAAIPRVEVLGGLSYFRAGVSNGANLFGWQANPDINFNKNVTVAVDLGGQYKDLRGKTVALYQYMVGPRLKYRTDRMTYFTHGLVGGNALHFVYGTQGALAFGCGGGVNLNVNNRVAIRMFQLDSIHDHRDSAWLHGIRGTSGIVFKFGIE